DPRVIAFGGDYLKIVSLNFVAAGIVFTVSSVFQGMGNTLPPLLSSITRLILFALPALLISRTFKEAKLADDMARKACGLDDRDAASDFLLIHINELDGS